MRTRAFVLGVLAVAIALAALAAAHLLRRAPPATFVTAPVSVGRIARGVLTTGTLEPVTTIEVGTQVSGTIASVPVDFNSLVHKGDVLARIDPATFDASVAAARAGVLDAQAQLLSATTAAADAHTKLDQAERLFKEQMIPEADFETALAAAKEADDQVSAAQSGVALARAQLEQASVNLEHTIIRSPVDGLVVSRSVDPGQTVAASVQTPVLFLVAPDLKKMQLEATIDEADVGGVHDGDPVSFTVDGYPDVTFRGTISAVRLATVEQSTNPTSGGDRGSTAAVGTSAATNAAAPQSTGSVLAYTAIVAVDNGSNLLRPGMTAVVTLTGMVKDHALRVPNAALSFRPAPGTTDAHTGTVWVLQPDGSAKPVVIQTGLSDERFTEVVGGTVHANDRVVTSVTTRS